MDVNVPKPVPLFALGQVVMTVGAQEAFKEAHQKNEKDTPFNYLIKHNYGDWGDLCEEDKAANQAALKDGSRILSAYHLATGVKIWIITEWDRSATTILLPEEY